MPKDSNVKDQRMPKMTHEEKKIESLERAHMSAIERVNDLSERSETPQGNFNHITGSFE